MSAEQNCIFLNGKRCGFHETLVKLNQSPLETVRELTGNPDPSALAVVEIGLAMSNPDNRPTRIRGNGLCQDAHNPAGQKKCKTYASRG